MWGYRIYHYGIRLILIRNVRHGYRGRPELYFDGSATNGKDKMKIPKPKPCALEVTGQT